MRYEPTKKAGVAPAREIAKVSVQTPLLGLLSGCNVQFAVQSAVILVFHLSSQLVLEFSHVTMPPCNCGKA